MPKNEAAVPKNKEKLTLKKSRKKVEKKYEVLKNQQTTSKNKEKLTIKNTKTETNEEQEQKNQPTTPKNKEKLTLEKAKLRKAVLEGEKLDYELRKMKGELVDSELLNKIISRTFGVLLKNLMDIPSLTVDEIIDLVNHDAEPKPKIINLLNKQMAKEFKNTLETVEREFAKLGDN
jgi:hypothetical protein